jgi:hypothetical protein
MFYTEGALERAACEETIGATEDRFGDQRLAEDPAINGKLGPRTMMNPHRTLPAPSNS